MRDRLLALLRRRWAYAGIVLLPTLLLGAYYLLLSTDRYVSDTRLIVEGDDPAGMATIALGLLTPNASGSALDAELVKSFILSPAMLDHLQETLDLRAHYSSPTLDPFSRMAADASSERFLKHYLNYVAVEIDEAAPIIRLRVQAFDRAYAQRLSAAIAERAERFVNEVGQSLAREQVAFVQGELDKTDRRLREETARLVNLQNRNRMLDPVLESQAVAQIIGGLQQELSRARTELKALQSFMSPTASEVVSQRKKIAAIQSQIEQERGKQVKAGDTQPLNDLVLQFKERELALQVATDVYQGSLRSLEAAKLDASRKVKHLVRVSGPTLPEASLMPRRSYNVTTLFFFLNLLYLIGGLLIASIRDHME
ncbi:hypothetical protein [Panacagrimonas sp.]|uniref:hypothetical protein n=1 Tax=Panacagrimonas sp. TaxID=2480088 RepID=UPI003B5299C3